jgi:hypothetical protein
LTPWYFPWQRERDTPNHGEAEADDFRAAHLIVTGSQRFDRHAFEFLNWQIWPIV